MSFFQKDLKINMVVESISGGFQERMCFYIHRYFDNSIEIIKSGIIPEKRKKEMFNGKPVLNIYNMDNVEFSTLLNKLSENELILPYQIKTDKFIKNIHTLLTLPIIKKYITFSDYKIVKIYPTNTNKIKNPLLTGYILIKKLSI